MCAQAPASQTLAFAFRLCTCERATTHARWARGGVVVGTSASRPAACRSHSGPQCLLLTFAVTDGCRPALQLRSKVIAAAATLVSFPPFPFAYGAASRHLGGQQQALPAAIMTRVYVGNMRPDTAERELEDEVRSALQAARQQSLQQARPRLSRRSRGLHAGRITHQPAGWA